MVSIIIPVYNVSNYLQQCLDSLKKAIGNVPTEIIIINDGSTDDSEEICRNYANNRQNVILVNKSNGGLSDARNAGIARANGDYIYFLDSDDWMASGALEDLYKVAIYENCDVVQGGYFYAYSDHLLVDKRFLTNNVVTLRRDTAMLELIKNDIVKNFAWGKLYKRSTIEGLLFPKGKYFEDSFWQHHVLNRIRKYGIVSKPLYYYRQRESSISGKYSLRNYDLIDGTLERLYFIQKFYPDFLIEMRRSLDGLFWQAYGLSKKDSNLLAHFNISMNKYITENTARLSFRANILKNYKYLYSAINMLDRISSRFKKDRYQTIPVDSI